MNVDDEWHSLAAAWQAQPVDLAALRRAAQRRAWRMKLLMAFDIAAAAAGIAFAVWLFVHGSGPGSRLGAAIGIAALAGSVLIHYRLRRGLWHAANDSLVSLLRLQRARRRNAIRMALWGPLFLPLGLLVGLLIGRDETTPALLPGLPLWLRLLLAAGIIIGFCIGSLLYVRRQRRRIASIDAHLAQFEPPG